MRAEEIVIAGGITEIVGDPSSGRTALLVACVREVTRRGALAALVDTDHVFDPTGAARAGVDLSRVLWVRCGHRPDRALRATDLLIRCPGFALIGLDTGEGISRLSLPMAYRLKLTLRKSGAALVVVSRHRIAASSATLALETSRRDLQWAGPGSVPMRLDRMSTAVRVVRASGIPQAPGGRGAGALPSEASIEVEGDLRPGAVHVAWWNA